VRARPLTSQPRVLLVDLSDLPRTVRDTMPSRPPVAAVPGLAFLWDSDANGHIDPRQVTVGSTSKRWWRCPEGPDHAWDASVQSVFNAVAAGRRGCPFCRGLRPSLTNRLDRVHPWLAEQWHPIRNGAVRALDVVAGSNAPRWWKCPAADDHVWQASPQRRAKAAPGAGCPFCANLRPSVTNRLDLLHRQVAAQWHPTRNGDVTTADIVATTQTPYWWQCPAGPDHEWQTPVHLRTQRGHGCPFCSNRRLSVTNSVAAKCADWLHLWHPTRNPLTAEQTLANTEVQVWWKCPAGPDHEWDEAPGRIAVNSWARGNTGCPCCAGVQPSVTNSVASVPALAAEWHPTANGGLTVHDVVAGTSQKHWWLCARCGHEWQATGANRVRGRGCPKCKTFLCSTAEICLAFELQTVLPDLDLDRDKVVLDGQVRHVDLVVQSARLVVELDGSYYHAGRDMHDAAKSDLLRTHGWRVVRVREQPLHVTHVDDVAVPSDAPVKVVADTVVARLVSQGWLDRSVGQAYLNEIAPRRLAAALGEVARRRPGKKIIVPGTPKGPSRRDRWESTYALLCAFLGRAGHARVPEVHVEGGVRLGPWVSQQRARYRRGELEADRAARLAVLPGWTWDPFADEWEAGYEHLLAFLDREGHLRVPTHHVEPDGYPLGTWVRSHRRAGGGRRLMTDDQAARLKAVPGWTYDSPREVFWERAYLALSAFATEHGHCRTPRASTVTDINVDAWSKQQRVAFHAGRLASDRARRLEHVPGWSWQPQDDAWEAGYAALRAFADREGHARVPRHHVEDGYPLGPWVGEQRNRRREMDGVRRTRLEAVPGWSFDPQADTWERHFAALESFVARKGHAGVPTDFVVAGLRLGAWVIRHRQEFKAGKLPADRAARLESLPGWMWDTRDARWQSHLAALRAFARREGHTRVPTDHLEGDVKLGVWVVATRSRRKSGDVDDVRAAELEQMPGWAWDAREAAWEDAFAALVAFVGRAGHCRVPRDHVERGVRLGQWASVQQQWQRSGRLRPDRAVRLAALPGWTTQTDGLTLFA
jgi:hypothetical protein